MKIIITLCLGLWTSSLCAQTPLLVGTYTDQNTSQGIYVFDFNQVTGKADLLSTTMTDNPSFLAKSNDNVFVYAVNELGSESASLNAYTFNGESLSFINKLPTEGSSPCHIALSKKDPIAVVSNYGGGSLALFRIAADGSLAERLTLIQHTGSGPDKKRQAAPYVHSAFFSPDYKRVYVQDLGTDQVTVYAVVKNKDHYTLVEEAVIQTPAGGGPRHIVLDKSEKTMYVLLEMQGEIAVYTREKQLWTLKQEISINTDDFTGSNGAAEIKMSKDGKFIYASNRGDANTIALFKIENKGALVKQAVYNVLGKNPRNFTFSPNGNFLLVGNQNSNEIVVFNVDKKLGSLADSGQRIPVVAPVCLVF